MDVHVQDAQDKKREKESSEGEAVSFCALKEKQGAEKNTEKGEQRRLRNRHTGGKQNAGHESDCCRDKRFFHNKRHVPGKVSSCLCRKKILCQDSRTVAGRERNRDMKHDRELREAIAQPSVYAGRLKDDTGKKVVGYVCSYLPEELILAAGAHPLRLLGTKENIHLADSHLQSYCCSLVRGILEEALSGKNDFLDGMVFPHTCDSIQRLSDIWRMNIPCGFHLDCVLPVKLDTESARDYMFDVLAKFRRDLEEKLEMRIAESELKKAIALTNAIRRRLKEIYALRCRFPALLPG